MAKKAHRGSKRAKATQSKKSAQRKTAPTVSSKQRVTKKATRVSTKTSNPGHVATKSLKKRASEKNAKTRVRANKKRPGPKASAAQEKKGTQPTGPTKSRATRKIVAKRRAASPVSNTTASLKRTEAALAMRKTAERAAIEKQGGNYEKAVGHFNNRKFTRALQWFEKVTKGPDSTLRHRAEIHIRICIKRMNVTKVKLRTADDYYNYGVQLINNRELEKAEKCLEKALRLSADADYIHYAAAVVRALRGNHNDALKSLRQAIELNSRNRLLARADADLSSLRNDPSWTELIS